jgi:hypothetical protein
MSAVVKIEDLAERVIEIKEARVFFAADVAQIYELKAGESNKKVTNNTDKGPVDYVAELTKSEKMSWWRDSNGSTILNTSHRLN